MHFSTDLGGLQPQKFRFKSYRKAPTTYTLEVEDKDFEGDAKVDAPAAEGDDGVEVELNVTFEPSKLGTTHATMLLKSAEGGDYIVNLHGECVPPKSKDRSICHSRTSSQTRRSSHSQLTTHVSPWDQ